MAKQIVGSTKFQVPGGQATPAPPVGTSLGKFGINLGQFVQQFNDRTKEYNGTPIPVVVNVYNDRTFDFVTKSPPAAASPPALALAPAVGGNRAWVRGPPPSSPRLSAVPGAIEIHAPSKQHKIRRVR